MPILFRQTSHDIAFGRSPIEKMGGDSIVTYSMYGEEPPMKETSSNFVFKLTDDFSGSNAYILINNNLYGVGRNWAYQFGSDKNFTATSFTLIAKNVKDFSAASTALCYIDTENNLYVIGSNNKGQLGLGSTTSITTFTKIASNVRKVRINPRNVTWYITNDGDLYMTGQNNYGQQSSGNTTDVLNFTKRLTNVRDVDVHTGSITAAILENNDLYMCGYGLLWSQGNNTQTNYSSFHKVAGNVKKVCADTEYSFYIANDGSDTMYVSGQLISYQNQYRGFTRYASQIKDVQTIDNEHLGYLTNDGKLYLGGRNPYGQCSTGSTSTATDIALRGSNVASMYLGRYVSWYLTNDGKLYGCGMGGQQGNGSTENVLRLTKRAENVKEAYVDTGSTWYIDNNGDLYGCGFNHSGAQGDVTKFTKVELPA